MKLQIICFYTLLKKEVLRFWKVKLQTIISPIVNTLTYLLIFSTIFNKSSITIYGNIKYINFLIPGLLIMTMLQNAFYNNSSSLMQAKITENIIFIFLTPINNISFILAFAIASVIRGLIISLLLFLIIFLLHPLEIKNFGTLAFFSFFPCLFMSLLGLLASLLSEKYEQILSFQNFIILPLIFLSGVFYSIHDLNGIWLFISKFNPLVYMIDGFRFSFFAKSDHNIYFSMLISLISCLFIFICNMIVLKQKYKI